MRRRPIDLPPEREVVCACPFSFHRPVLRDHTGVNLRVSGCLRCGAVSVTESIVEEPRPHQVICVANRLVEIDDAALAWLAGWPRVGGSALDWRDPYYLAAAVRVADEAELASLEAKARVAQRPLPRLARLRLVGFPTEPPPKLGLPLHTFELVFRDLVGRE